MAAESASAASWRPRSAARVAVRRSARLSPKGTASAAIASSERRTSTRRTRSPISGVQPKTEAAHRLKRQPDELGPQLSDEEVQRPRAPDHRGAPDLQHELFAADRLTLTSGEGGQDLEFGP